MNWTVNYTRSAFKELKEIPKTHRSKIKEAIETLSKSQNPKNKSEKLQQHLHLYRFRVGSYRIIFTLREKEKILVILRIAHRKEAYRNLVKGGSHE